MLRVKNNKTGVESNLTEEQYAKVKNDPNWKGTFTVVQTIPVEAPKEVKELAEKKAAIQTEKKADEKK